MTGKLEIRPYDPADLPRVQEIRRAAFAPVFASFREIVGEKIAGVAFARADEEHAEYLDGLVQADSGSEMWVVLQGDEAIGFMSLSYNTDKKLGEIGLNAVDPDHAGRGVGTWMYEFALDRMRKRGMLAVEVGTGGDPSHAPARRAYEKAGFGPAIPSVAYYKLL